MAGFWYRAGTVSVTNASKKVIGSGTLFKTTTFKPDKGHAFYGPDGKPYEIDYVESDTVLYLVKAYTGVTASGQSYEIDITRTSTIPALSREISAQLAYAQGQYDSWQQILTGAGDVTLTAPDARQITVPALSNMLSKSGNLSGLADKAAARANLGAYKQGDATGVDLNTVTSTGEYQVGGSEAHWPFPGTGGHMYVHDLGGAVYVTQIAVGGTGLMAVRYRSPSGWPASWTNFIRQTDIGDAATKNVGNDSGSVPLLGNHASNQIIAGSLPVAFATDRQRFQQPGSVGDTAASLGLGGCVGEFYRSASGPNIGFALMLGINGAGMVAHEYDQGVRNAVRFHDSKSLPIVPGVWSGYINGVSEFTITDCSYVRHGNLVHIRGYLSFYGMTVPANDGILRGLPFTPKVLGASTFIPCSLYRARVSNPDVNMYLQGGASVLYVGTVAGGPASFESGADYMFSATYEIA